MKNVFREADNILFKHTKGPHGLVQDLFHIGYEFFFLLNGDVELVHEHGKKTLEPYEFVFIPPGRHHKFLVTGNLEEYERCVMIFPSDLIFRTNKTIPNEIFTISQHELITSCILRCMEYYEKVSEKYFTDILKCIINEIYTLILSHEFYNNPITSNSGGILDVAIEYIDNNIDKKITAEDIAKHCYLSVSTLSHKFKIKYEISLMKYVERKKMLTARRYLNQGYMPIEVCNMLGYNEYSTFYRSYVKHFNSRPSKNKNASVFYSEIT